jgi:DNA-binding NtrC family response regulator
LAECIHVGSREAESSFVPVYCDLLSTEALYDALRNLQRMAADHSGAHEHPGMLLLIDVDRMPREVQQWLLDQLANYHSVRLASTSSVPLTNVVAEGWMLADFQQLIAPIEINLPPLHVRGQDVLLLALEFIQLNRRLNRTTAVELNQEAAAELLAYHWPGNVRELQRVIHESCESCSGDVISTEDLPFAFRAGMDAQAMAPAVTKPFESLDKLMQSAERQIIEATLVACSGNKTEVARRLGLTRPSLYRRLKSLGLGEDEPPQG